MWTLILRFVVRRLIKSKLFWIAVLTVPIAIVIATNAIYFFIFNMMVNRVEAQALEQAEKAKSILSIYTEEFLTEEKVEVPEVGEAPEIPIPGNEDGKYDGTIGEAENIAGTSLLHQIHNAIVDVVNANSFPGYTYSYVLGTNYTESSGSGGPWIPWQSAPMQATQETGFSLKDWSYEDAVTWKERTGHNLKSYRRYISAFQIDYKDWKTGMSTPSSSWGMSEWGTFVNSATPNLDGSGDGKSDPHNYLDALKAQANHAKGKSTRSSKVKLLDETGREDMISMLTAFFYVGGYGRDGSRLVGGTHYVLDSYPVEEGLNPHVDLIRSAYNEYRTNGVYYQKFKQLLEGQSTTSPHSTEFNAVIDNFYMANGWTKVGNGFKKNYSDGNGYIYISGPGNNPQDVYYPFKVFWSGKIGEENIKNILEKSNH